jgi:hypothetical protein
MRWSRLSDQGFSRTKALRAPLPQGLRLSSIVYGAITTARVA